ncbi:MAG: hypothetical protein ABSG42_07245, partial [Nitrospirota bacterium]
PGTIETIAGKGRLGYQNGGFSGDGGPAIDACISGPKGVSVDKAGNIYFIDYFNLRIRKIDVSKEPPVITSVAGGGNDSFVEGVPATSVRLVFPEDLALDGKGNVYIAEPGARVVLKIDAKNGTISRAAGNYSRWQVGDGVPAVNSSLRNPIGIAVDDSGNLYIADEHAHRIRRVDAATGIMTTVAGNGSSYGPFKDGAPATKTAVPFPRDLAIDRAGNIFLLDMAGVRVRIREVYAATGIIRTLCYVPRDVYSIRIAPDGLLYITGGDRLYSVDPAKKTVTCVAGSGKKGFSGDGGPASAASFDTPHGVAVNAGGCIYIADTDNNRIRKITPK